jgi:predicted benzoate:H+ symporter BenE
MTDRASLVQPVTAGILAAVVGFASAFAVVLEGFEDPGPSPIGTLEYYESARQTTGLDASLRLFLLSGVYHCRGGPRADGFDSLAAPGRLGGVGTGA